MDDAQSQQLAWFRKLRIRFIDAKDFWFAVQNSLFIVASILSSRLFWAWPCHAGQPIISRPRHCTRPAYLTLFRYASG